MPGAIWPCRGGGNRRGAGVACSRRRRRRIRVQPHPATSAAGLPRSESLTGWEEAQNGRRDRTVSAAATTGVQAARGRHERRHRTRASALAGRRPDPLFQRVRRRRPAAAVGQRDCWAARQISAGSEAALAISSPSGSPCQPRDTVQGGRRRFTHFWRKIFKWQWGGGTSSWIK